MVNRMCGHYESSQDTGTKEINLKIELNDELFDDND